MKKEEVEILEARLREKLPEGEWHRILTIMDITGIVDNRQLQATTGFGRDRLRRLLEKMETCRAGLPPLFGVSEKKLTRPNLQGRQPKVYTLGKGGEALLRHLGEVSARAYTQRSPIAMAHALAVFDVDLAAKQAGLAVETEKQLHATKQVYIRPDNLVTLSGGRKLIFEVEQLAKPDYLPRITHSVRHKTAFFRRNTDERIVSEIRMLFNLKPGRLYQKTLQRWESVLALLAKEEPSGTLPFSLHAMTLADFLAEPDWSESPSVARWRVLSATTPTTISGKDFSTKALPQPLQAFRSKQNMLILEALWQEFQAQGHHKEAGVLFPDPQFLELVQVIYLASHRKTGSALEGAAFPHASLYLLQQYLLMRPDLRERLNRVIRRGGRALHWNATTILHRIQALADEFLAYHGFRSNGTLQVFAQVVDWHANAPKSFALSVKISSPELLSQEWENYSPRREDLQRAEQALAWVLRALFIHPERVGLYPLPF